MEMYPPGAAGGFWAALVKIDEFEMGIIAMLKVDFVSETSTFCFVIFNPFSQWNHCKNKRNWSVSFFFFFFSHLVFAQTQITNTKIKTNPFDKIPSNLRFKGVKVRRSEERERERERESTLFYESEQSCRRKLGWKKLIWKMEGNPRTKQVSKIRRKEKKQRMRRGSVCMGCEGDIARMVHFIVATRHKRTRSKNSHLLGPPLSWTLPHIPRAPPPPLSITTTTTTTNCEKTRRLRRHRNRSSPLQSLLVGHLNSSVHVALTHLTWVPATWALRSISFPQFRIQGLVFP